MAEPTQPPPADRSTDTPDPTGVDSAGVDSAGVDSSAEDTAGVDSAEDAPVQGSDARPGGLLRDHRVAWGVAVLALLAATVFAYQWRVLAGEASDVEQAREAAEVMAARITTFEGATIDEFVERLRELATGDYADQVAELFSPDFRAALREHEVESVGEVVRSFVQELDGDEAEVFVVVRQTSANAAVGEPVTDELRMEITLAREDGRWLVADVGVLGPTPSAITDPGPATGEPDGDQG